MVALLVVGPVLTLVTGLAPAVGASGAASPVLSGSLVTGLFAWLIAVAVSTVFALVVARLTTWRLGVTCLGLCLLWSVWGTPGIDDLVRIDPAASPVAPLAIDGLLLALFACAGAFVVMCYSGQSATSDENEPAEFKPAHFAPAIAGCAIGALLACFLIAQDERVGQALGAAVVAGFAGGALGRAFAPKAPAWVLLAGFPVAALAAPFIGNELTKGALVDAVFDGSLSSLLRVMPAYWAAGLLIGFPAGSAQGEAMVQKQEHRDNAAGKPARRAATS